MTETITISRQEYQDLIDARDMAVAARQVASGEMPTIGESEMDAYLAAPTPLAFWRKQRGFSQASLATAAGVSQPYVAQLEGGQRIGDVMTLARLARLLTVRIEDLIAESSAG